MTYTPQTWTNGAAGGTPLSAARLGHIETGLTTLDTGKADVVLPVYHLDAYANFFGGWPFVTGQAVVATTLTAQATAGTTTLSVASASGMSAGVLLVTNAGSSTQQILRVTGAVAIGKDSGGTAASTSTQDEFVLGTTNHKVRIRGTVGFYDTAPAAKPTVTGSRGGNAALASLLTALAGLGLITDSTSA